MNHLQTTATKFRIIEELIDINIFEKDEVRDVLHGLVDELDKEQVTEILPNVLTELYAKPRSMSQF